MSFIIPRSRIDPRVERAEDERFKALCEAEDAQIAREESREPVHTFHECPLCLTATTAEGVCVSCYRKWQPDTDYGDWKREW